METTAKNVGMKTDQWDKTKTFELTHIKISTSFSFMSRSCLLCPDSSWPLRPQSGPFDLREFWCGAESYGTYLSRLAEGIVDWKSRRMTL